VIFLLFDGMAEAMPFQNRVMKQLPGRDWQQFSGCAILILLRAQVLNYCHRRSRANLSSAIETP
jgi:hypothetical protein